ncbi:hypothetical protein JKF63_02574 [Porcisia hertigi]|uniref:Uncharacterized protein n=1 Tax=Porcisia hertigi TaxID=2761500 RepID=A0A836IJY1_9TRYP|nr:hypothetical protein JKF63_02574 [Porcisia hertigi]
MSSQTRRMRLYFVDSSDDGASHEAVIEVGSLPDDGEVTVESSTRGAVSTGAVRQPFPSGEEVESKRFHQGDKDGGWLSSVLYKGANAVAGLLTGPRSTVPYGSGGDTSPNRRLTPSSLGDGGDRAAGRHTTGRRISSSSSDGGWEYDGSRSRSITESVPSTDSATPWEDRGDLEGGSEYDQVNLDLKDTVLLFMETGSDVFLNIILATLKASTELVDGEIFQIVSRSPALLKVFLDSGRVDIDDARVQSVVQAKLDEVLDGDPYNGDVVPGDLLSYVRYLCSIRTSRITFQQMVLLRYSGFDYVELLIDYPYLLENLQKPSLCLFVVLDLLHYINIAFSCLSVLVTLLFVALVTWTVVFWFRQPDNRNNGYWTIITYIGGYVVSIVATMRAEEGKIKRYDNQIWRYPDNTFRIVPIIPVYEMMLSYVSLRYELLADSRRFFIIRYDLRNGTFVQQIINGLFYALPQLIVQTFFFFGDYDTSQFKEGVVFYWVILGSSSTLILMSILALYRIALFTHSCSERGFALLSSQNNTTEGHIRMLARRVRPSDIATKLLIFFSMLFFIADAVTLIIFLLELRSGSRGVIVFTAIDVAIVGISIILVAAVYVNLPLSRGMGAICVPALLLEIAFIALLRANTNYPDLKLFDDHPRVWVIPSLVAFGALCVSFVTWIVMLLLEFFRGARITQQALDHYLLV